METYVRNSKQIWRFAGLTLYTLCFKNVPPLTCYNLDIHDPITIIFGRIVTGKVANQTMLCFPRHPSSASAKEKTQKTAHWCIVHATLPNCCRVLDFLSP